MTVMRRCSKTACSRSAVATLTYVYADKTAVLGPLATYAEPHTYDLCGAHAERLTAPQGWEIVRLLTEIMPSDEDDLLAVANALLRPSAPPPLPRAEQRPIQPPPTGTGGPPATRKKPGTPGDPNAGRRGHLRILPDN